MNTFPYAYGVERRKRRRMGGGKCGGLYGEVVRCGWVYGRPGKERARLWYGWGDLGYVEGMRNGGLFGEWGEGWNVLLRLLKEWVTREGQERKG